MKVIGEPNFKDVEQGDIHLYDSILDNFSFNEVSQQIPKLVKTITFVTTGILKFDGGQTSMLHLGTELEKLGYKVFYLSYKEQSEESMRRNAEFNYNKYLGECISVDKLDVHKSDVWIATLWESVYIIRNKPGYKMYFVQDYEPYFYPYGDQSFLAKKTYEIGLHMVSLGKWCMEKIKKYCNFKGRLDYVTFPCDIKDYSFKKRDFEKYKYFNHIKIAVYTKWISPRRAPITIQLLCRNLIRKFKNYKKNLQIFYYGSDKKFNFINGINLGKLNKKELNQLYQKVDFGIVPSMTNISLVPFEMISTGLPVIDFEEGSGSAFLDDNCVIRTNLDSESTFRKIIFYINNPQMLENLIYTAKIGLKNLTWKNTASEFNNIIQKVLEKNIDFI